MRSKTLVSFLVLLVLPVAVSQGQEEELAMMEEVAKWQSQLNAAAVKDRDQAQEKLLAMGPEILPFLKSATEESTTDFRGRVSRIRKQLETEVVNQASQASQVTLNGAMTVGQALQKIKRQTRNQVVVADPSLADIEIDLAIKGKSFWKTIDELMSKAKLTIDPYGGSEPGQLSLTRAAGGNRPLKLPTSSNLIFQTQVIRADASVNLQRPELDYTTVTLLVRWEPRLRPFSVDIPMSSVSIVDEYEDEVVLPNPEEVVYGMVQPEIPQVEFSLTLPRVDRQVETLKSLSAKINTLLPGKTEEFRFKKLSKMKPGTRIEKAGARVEFGGTRKNEDVYSVQVSISFDKENNALESHQGWVFQNEVYLLDRQGNREEAVSLETIQQDNERVTVVYYFLEEPGDRTLVYKTPASIIKLPVDIELTKIPLP